MNKILLVDDDIELSALLRDYLDREGYAVSMVRNGEDGVREALEGGYGLVVLDVMMPGMGGIEALRSIRAVSRVPVLMLTARGDDVDRIVGLELGADDYLPKPCNPRELVARIRAILRRARSEHPADGPLVVGALSLWPGKRLATWAGRPVDLTSTEFNLLESLTRGAGRPVSKAELSEQGLGRPLARYDRSVDVHMSSLRHKLGPLGDGRSCIQTVRGLGYQLIRD
ncbi:MAG: response regulator transcription factor [Pseudomonadota bacterium]